MYLTYLFSYHVKIQIIRLSEVNESGLGKKSVRVFSNVENYSISYHYMFSNCKFVEFRKILSTDISHFRGMSFEQNLYWSNNKSIHWIFLVCFSCFFFYGNPVEPDNILIKQSYIEFCKISRIGYISFVLFKINFV